jgi:hypothetical protein
MKQRISFKGIKSAFLKWYNERYCRKIFVYCALIAAAVYVLSLFVRGETATYIFFVSLFCIAAALGASITDTAISRQKFLKQIEKVENEHRIREVEIMGYLAQPSCFSEADIRQIKKQKAGFLFLIAFKVIFILILFGLLGVTIVQL